MIPFTVADLPERPERFSAYIDESPARELGAALAAHRDPATMLDAAAFVRRAGHAYAPGKWSAASVALHLADTERVFAYRALRIARGDPTALPGFDENLFAAHDNAAARAPAAILAELAAVRAATIALADGLDRAALLRRGTCSGIAVSAGALLFAIAGHHAHHLRVLRERYLA